jgi:hypothetical protein
MSNPVDTDETGTWPRGWEEAELDTLCRLARMPLCEKLEWLEEAGRIVENLTETRLHADVRNTEEHE